MRLLFGAFLLLLFQAASYIGWVPAGTRAVEYSVFLFCIYLVFESIFSLNEKIKQSEEEESEFSGNAVLDALERENASLRARLKLVGPAQIVKFVGALQEKGRFLDFVSEDVGAHADERVSAVARVVHQGCQSVVKEYLELEPVYGGVEGEALKLKANYDPSKYRVIGKVAGDPPYSGKVLHRGWKAVRVSAPDLTVLDSEEGARIITPTEVEVQ